jgi:hypothetical protein
MLRPVRIFGKMEKLLRCDELIGLRHKKSGSAMGEAG